MSCPKRTTRFRPSCLAAPLRRAALGSLLVAALASAGCGSEPAPTPTKSPTPAAAPAPKEASVKVVVLGDSISAGLGLPADQAFPAVVEDLLRAEGLDIAVQNAGVSGDTSSGGAARIDWLLKQEPQVLVVELGGNDLLRGQPVAVTRAKLSEIVAAGKRAGAAVVLVGISAPGSVGAEHKAAFDALYPAVAREHDITLLPGFLDPLMGQPDLLQSDGLHPTAEGQKLLASALAPVLRSVVNGLAKPAKPTGTATPIE